MPCTMASLTANVAGSRVSCISKIGGGARGALTYAASRDDANGAGVGRRERGDEVAVKTN